MLRPVDGAGQAVNIAYFTTSYPSVSHTFIRREIHALEDLGVKIRRFALRPGEGLVDELDRKELPLTEFVLSQPWRIFTKELLRGLWLAGISLLPALRTSLQLHRRSDRGLFRHIAYLLEALVLRSKLHHGEIDHVHVHFGTNAAAVALLARIMGGPTYSMTVHGPDEFDAPIGFSLGLKMKHAEFTAAISSFGTAQLKRWAPVEEWGKIRLIRCAVGQEWFNAAGPIPEDSRTLVCIGRLSAQKGQLLLIDAFAEAIERGIDHKLVLVGDGELRSVIEERIRSLGLEEHVRITGWQSAEQIRALLLQSRALVLPSFAEGLPVVIMEAFAMARPVLSTAIMGIPELVKDGTSGWLVAAGDSQRLRDAILELAVTSNEHLHEMGRAGQALVQLQHKSSTEATKLRDALR